MLKQKLYFIYAGFWFVAIFLLIYPLFLVATLHPTLHKFSRIPYKIWSYTFFPVAFLPVRKVWRFKPKPKQAYVFVANHCSYLDIPVLTYTLPGYFVYIGKASLTKIPLFGYKFKKLHITLDRKSVQDKRRVVDEGKARIRKGHSLVVFPEGGINPKPQPNVRTFKDGAFKIAIEQQVPIVPVTIVNTWRVLPDVGKALARPARIRVVLHEPLDTTGLKDEDLPMLRERTKQLIEEELFKGN